MAQKTVSIGEVTFANDKPFVLVGGVNVLESEQFAVDVAGTYKEICACLLYTSPSPRDNTLSRMPSSA